MSEEWKRYEADFMADRINWPQPTFVKEGQGQRLNPERAKYAYEIIKSELTIGELFEVAAMIMDGTGYICFEESIDQKPDLFRGKIVKS